MMKPCPFCGYKRIEHTNDYKHFAYGANAWYCRCVKCGAQGPTHGTKGQATREWNLAPRHGEIE